MSKIDVVWDMETGVVFASYWHPKVIVSKLIIDEKQDNVIKIIREEELPEIELVASEFEEKK